MRRSTPGIGPCTVALGGLFALSFLAVQVWQGEPAAPDPERWGPANSPATKSAFAVSGEAPAAAPRHGSGSTRGGDVAGSRDLVWLSVPRMVTRAAPPVAEKIETAAADASAREIPVAPELVSGSGRLDLARSESSLAEDPAPAQSLPRQAAELEPAPRAFAPPESLLRQLADLAELGSSRAWALGVLDRLRQLSVEPSVGTVRAGELLEQLAAFAQSPAVLNAEGQAVVTGELARAQQGLRRRVAVWQQIHRCVLDEPQWQVALRRGDVGSALQEVEARLAQHPRGAQWQTYLLLDPLRVASQTADLELASRRQLAQRVLGRMTASQLSEEQRKFLAEPAFEKLRDPLHLWAYEPVDYAELLAQLEAWERGDVASESAVAEAWRTLHWSPWEQTATLARALDTHYRNANLRVAISGDLINRLVPSTHETAEPVADRVLGVPVRGQSQTVSQLAVELIPDRARWQLGLIVRGQVASRTLSDKGPVTFVTRGAARYRAQKRLTIDRRGTLLHRAEARADNQAELANLATQFDDVPIVGSLVRSVARRGHAGSLDAANAEVALKIGHRVAQRLDDEAAQQLAAAEQRYRQRMLEPLRKLQLEPDIVDMQTTDKRLIVRYRLATDQQLAAHSPRPLAPADSVFSVQINESALNNLVGQLRLQGRRLPLLDLYRELNGLFGGTAAPPENLPANLIVQFAEEQPVRVRLVDERVELTLRLNELRSGRESWYDFEVFTRFTPRIADRQVQLVREDIIELRGPHLGFRERVPLRTIFGAILARDRALSVLHPSFTERPELRDLGVSQFVIRDGWLALALSPETARSTPAAPVESATRHSGTYLR